MGVSYLAWDLRTKETLRVTKATYYSLPEDPDAARAVGDNYCRFSIQHNHAD